jgi:integrase
LLARAGLPRIRLHDVRHTVATLLAQERDVTLTDISRLLGHASTAVTEAVYIHRRFEDQRMAVGAIERIFSQRTKEA